MAARLELQFGGLSNRLDRHKIQFGKCFAMSNVSIDKGTLEVARRYSLVSRRTGYNAGDVCWGFGYGQYSCNDVYRIYQSGGPPTSGTFTITVGLNGSSQTTAALQYNASNDDIQAAVEALSNVTPGEVKVYGGPLPSEQVYVEAVGKQARTAFSAFTITDSSTPGSFAAAKYTAAGDYEMFLAAIQEHGETDATLYTIAASTGVWTEHGQALDASDWIFSQYRDRIYAVNAADGFHYYRIGAPSGFEWDDAATNASAGNGSPLNEPSAVAHYVDPANCMSPDGTISLGSGFTPSSPTGDVTTTEFTLTSASVYRQCPAGTYVDITLNSALNLYGRSYFVVHGLLTCSGAYTSSTIVSPVQRLLYYDSNSNDMYEIRKASGSASVTNGTFTITVNYESSSQTTSAINWNATADDVRAALESLSNIDAGEVKVTGGPLPNTSLIVELISPSSGKVTFTSFTVADSTSGTLEAAAYIPWCETVAATGIQTTQMSSSNAFVAADKPSKRAAVTKFRVYLGKTVWGTGAATMTASFTIQAFGNWMFDSQPYKPNFACAAPSNTRVQYAYSYVDVSEQKETNLSPCTQSISSASSYGSNNPVAQYEGNSGGEVLLYAPGNQKLTTSDKVYFYRREYLTGLWRRLQNADGSYGVPNQPVSTSFFADVFQEHHLAEFPQPAPGSFTLAGMVGQTAMCVFKGSLVVGGDRKVWISYQGEPGTFAPDPETTDLSGINIDDPYEARTLFMSQDRSEPIVGLCGDDALYAAGDRASYAMLGDEPQNMTPFRMLPNSRPALSSRGVVSHFGGAIVAAKDGLWIYKAVRQAAQLTEGNTLSENILKEQRTSWDAFVGASGSGIVLCGFNDRLWAFNAAKYICYEAGGEVSAGTWQGISVKAALAHPSDGVYFIGTEGSLALIGETDDDDAGADVPWSYETGVILSERAAVTGMEIYAEGNPKVEIQWYDSSEKMWKTAASYQRSEGDPFVRSVRSKPSTRHIVKISGESAADSVQALVLIYGQTGVEGKV